MFTPPRVRGSEVMDDPMADPRLVLRTLEDVEVANRMFGGTRAVMKELESVISDSNGGMSLLDVGTGAGDIPRAAAALGTERGVRIESVGVDAAEAPLRTLPMGLAVRGDARSLPFRDHSFDVAMCSQVLHHFDDANAAALLREMHRVARVRVIVSDIRRHWLAVAGIWLASFPMRFHPVSRHDGVVSVLRGYTTSELRSLVHSSVGVVPHVRARAGFRITASWTPVRSGEFA